VFEGDKDSSRYSQLVVWGRHIGFGPLPAPASSTHSRIENTGAGSLSSASQQTLLRLFGEAGRARPKPADSSSG